MQSDTAIPAQVTNPVGLAAISDILETTKNKGYQHVHTIAKAVIYTTLVANAMGIDFPTPSITITHNDSIHIEWAKGKKSVFIALTPYNSGHVAHFNASNTDFGIIELDTEFPLGLVVGKINEFIRTDS